MATTATLIAQVKQTGAKSATSELKSLANQADRTETATEKLERESLELAKALSKEARAGKGAAASLKALGGVTGSVLGKTSLLVGGVVGLAGGILALGANIDVLKSDLILLADLAGTSVQEFQKMSTAFRSVNFDAEKTADVLKDINDKVGQFVLTGGGEFRDVWEKVLKPIGKTKEELTELGPGGILLAVAEGFDTLGFNAKEATAIMEALANDSTALIPLLEDNGKALKEISFELENRGLLVTPEDEESLRRANKELSEMSALFSNIFTKIQGGLARVIFGDNFPETVADINTEIEQLETRIEELRSSEGIFDFTSDDKEVIQAQLRISDLIGAKQQLIEVEKQAQEQAKKTAQIQKTGDERRANEIAVERQAAAEKLDLQREIEEEKLSLELAKQADFEARQQVKAERDLAREAQSAERRTQLLTQLNESEKETIARQSAERLAQLEKDRAKELISEEKFEAAKKALKINSDKATAQLDQRSNEARIAGVGDALGTISSLMNSSNQELFRIGQAAAIANAIINIALGVTNALSLGPIIGPPLATLVGVAGAVQIATIASQQPPSARQQGGQFQAGQQLLVGEAGPEIVEFNQGGRVATATDTTRMTAGATPVPEIIIINQTDTEIAEPDVSIDEQRRLTILIRTVVSGDIQNPNSQVSKAISRNTSAQRSF